MEQEVWLCVQDMVTEVERRTENKPTEEVADTVNTCADIVAVMDSMLAKVEDIHVEDEVRHALTEMTIVVEVMDFLIRAAENPEKGKRELARRLSSRDSMRNVVRTIKNRQQYIEHCREIGVEKARSRIMDLVHKIRYKHVKRKQDRVDMKMRDERAQLPAVLVFPQMRENIERLKRQFLKEWEAYDVGEGEFDRIRAEKPVSEEQFDKWQFKVDEATKRVHKGHTDAAAEWTEDEDESSDEEATFSRRGSRKSLREIAPVRKSLTGKEKDQWDTALLALKRGSVSVAEIHRLTGASREPDVYSATWQIAL